MNLLFLPPIKDHIIEFTPAKFEFTVGGKTVTLTKYEYIVLYHLVARPYYIMSPEHIIASIHGDGYMRGESSAKALICSIRKKLGKYKINLVNVIGVGYKWISSSEGLTTKRGG